MSTEPKSRHALIDCSDEELREGIRKQSKNTVYSVNDCLSELHRRELRRQSQLTMGIGVVAVIVAVASVIVAWLK